MSTYTVTARDSDGAATTIQIDLTGAGATAVAKVARAINAKTAEDPFGLTLDIAVGSRYSADETEADL